MIIGSGIDIVAVPRLERFRERHGRKGLLRLFTESELDYSLRQAWPARSLAARFAAKEAFYKALGTGVGSAGAWVDVEVVRAPGGSPSLLLHRGAARTAERLSVERIHLSLSHSDEFAVASVILEGERVTPDR